AAEELSIHELFDLVLSKTGYLDYLLAEGQEGRERAENVRELASSIVRYEEENEEPTLSGYLEEVALISDIDSYEEGADAVTMMTVHSAKGLEFERVFLIGMEEETFPSSLSIAGGMVEIEEERRLAYVAITRAKKTLDITNTNMRVMFGSTKRNPPSRFVDEIPKTLCDVKSERRYFQTGATSIQKPRQSDYDYKNVFKAPTTSATASAACASYKVGMSVEHKTFGRGMITAVSPMGNDSMLEIAFESVGTKKLMAGFAKLKII
ncbi:MAG: ATP-binding domain-containing protein, partial [Clostridia bacterium]|nr:ATP-binding domain-containing protein [Clostridia bacterium]